MEKQKKNQFSSSKDIHIVFPLILFHLTDVSFDDDDNDDKTNDEKTRLRCLRMNHKSFKHTYIDRKKQSASLFYFVYFLINQTKMKKNYKVESWKFVLFDQKKNCFLLSSLSSSSLSNERMNKREPIRFIHPNDREIQPKIFTNDIVLASFKQQQQKERKKSFSFRTQCEWKLFSFFGLVVATKQNTTLFTLLILLSWMKVKKKLNDKSI